MYPKASLRRLCSVFRQSPASRTRYVRAYLPSSAARTAAGNTRGYADAKRLQRTQETARRTVPGILKGHRSFRRTTHKGHCPFLHLRKNTARRAEAPRRRAYHQKTNHIYLVWRSNTYGISIYRNHHSSHRAGTADRFPGANRRDPEISASAQRRASCTTAAGRPVRKKAAGFQAARPA